MLQSSPSFRLFVLALLSLPASATPAQQDPIKIGAKPPAFSARKLDGAPIRLEDYRGRVVVLEFWATWCGPCVAAIPHLNELVTKLEKDPVTFISITNEPSEVIADFLRRDAMKTVVARDADSVTFKAYGVTAIPKTVIIGKDGKVIAVTYPTMLSPNNLRSVAKGEGFKPGTVPSTAGKGEIIGLLDNGDAANPPTFSMVLRPEKSRSATELKAWGKDRLSFIATPPIGMVGVLYGNLWIVSDGSDLLPKEPWSMAAIVPNEADLMPLARAAFESTFGVKVERGEREIDVYVLKQAPSGAKLKPTTGDEITEYLTTRMNFGREEVGRLAGILQWKLNLPVIDETGLKGRYDYSLEFGDSSEEWLTKQLSEKLGLVLTRTKRRMDVLVLSKRQPR